jgi:hypothetical protein
VWVGLEEWIVGDEPLVLRPGGRLEGFTVQSNAWSIAATTHPADLLVDRSAPDPHGFTPHADLVGTVVWSRGQVIEVRTGDRRVLLRTTDHATRRVGHGG